MQSCHSAFSLCQNYATGQIFRPDSQKLCGIDGKSYILVKIELAQISSDLQYVIHVFRVKLPGQTVQAQIRLLGAV